MNAQTPFSFVSFNINGTKDKDLLISELLENDIVFLQEHLLSKVNVDSLKRSRTHYTFLRAAQKTRGRPSGDLAIYFRHKTQPILLQSDANILAIKCGDTAFINNYFPCNKKTVQSLSSFSQACNRLRTLLSDLSKQNTKWVLAGDMNTDLLSNSDRSEIFLDSLPGGFHLADKDLLFTYVHNRGGLTSNLDHVIVSDSTLLSSIVHEEDSKIDDDHLPITCQLSCSMATSVQPNSPKWFSKLNWENTNVPLCVLTLSQLLSSIKGPFHLLQTSVSTTSTRIDINSYYQQIVFCIKSAAKTAVPSECVRTGTRNPFWKVDPKVKIAKQKAKFWLRVWIACNRPSSGSVHQIKQKTKREYKYSLRRAKLNAWDGPCDKKSWDRVINSVKCSPPINSSLQLCDFVSHYKNILLSFNINLQNHFTKLVYSILPIRINQCQVLSVESGVILRALMQVNKSESLDSDGLCFKFFAYDCPELLKHLQLLFQMCLAQSVVPDSFFSGCISPIVKRGKDPSACSNYRPITVSCFVSKLFEYVLLPAINSKWNFTPFQLGFRKGMGCFQAHHIVGRLMKQAVAQKSPLYCLTVYISSAFDNVIH